MTGNEIRQKFLDYFAAQGHRRVHSSSLVPANDPTLLFTNAGMNQFKDIFTGAEKRDYTRATSSQKCVRAGGKHNDLENVGFTRRHHTFFEMLGNFSFGDYFKREAIAYAWELSRDVFGFAESDIWVTVFAGDQELDLGPDQEAIDCWLEVGVPRERIVECPRSENFWQAGPTGPCGPCSELYFDRGVAYGSPEDLPGGENERFLEYWNLVFMQYDQQGAVNGGAHA